MSEPIPFGVIGAGWRAEFFVRIARALPERFRLTAVAVRDPGKRAEFARRCNVPTVADVDALTQQRPAFVLVSVPSQVSPDFLCELAGIGMPALGETPPAATLDALLSLFARLGHDAPVQIAEQYPFQPFHAARLSLAAGGQLGDVSQAQVSVAHGYHGVVLLRRLLGVRFEPASIRAMTFHAPATSGPGRDGPPTRETIGTSTQRIAWMQFGDKLGVYDFDFDQYMSWIRSNRMLVRGVRGEIANLTVRTLADYTTPLATELRRWDTGHDGNLEGYDHRGITLGDRWLYRNPFPGARLSDDEIAGATCLAKMRTFVETGEAFYGLAEASQDHYLGLCIDAAAQSGEKVVTTTQPWAT